MFIESLSKGLAVLEAFEPDRPALKLSEIVSKTGLTLGSVQRITHTLTSLGYLEKDETQKTYRVGPRVLLLTRSYMQSVDLQRASQGPMRDLAEEVEMTVTVGVRSGLETVYVLRVGTREKVVVPNVWIGSTLPLQFTSIGKALLAFLPTGETEQILSQIEFPFQTNTRTVTEESFRETLVQTRRDGYAINDRDLRPDVRSLAAPIFNQDSSVVAALGVAVGSNARSLDELHTSVAPRVIRAAKEISLNLGYIAEGDARAAGEPSWR